MNETVESIDNRVMIVCNKKQYFSLKILHFDKYLSRPAG